MPGHSDRTGDREQEIRGVISGLALDQDLAALATGVEGEPYVNLVAFALAPDLDEIYFVTPRGTRKFANLTANPRAALLMDNRSGLTNPAEGLAVTAIGRATEIRPDLRGEPERIYLTRHPGLTGFLNSPDAALFRLKVEHYICAKGLDAVTSLEMRGS